MVLSPLPSPTRFRYERKFVVRDRPLSDVLALIRWHPALFREAYPPRAVNSLYFDTIGLRGYFDHVNGIANREKTRIRWYGPFSGLVPQPVLERKLKRGHLSHKLSYPLEPLNVNGGISPTALRQSLRGCQLAEEAREQVRELEPALANRYHRHYFLSADGLFRLTVDTALKFFECRRGRGELIPWPEGCPGVILELKFDQEQAEEAVEVANALPFRLTRCSKYVLGIESLRGASNSHFDFGGG
jgi:hypothetical protein